MNFKLFGSALVFVAAAICRAQVDQGAVSLPSPMVPNPGAILIGNGVSFNLKQPSYSNGVVIDYSSGNLNFRLGGDGPVAITANATTGIAFESRAPSTGNGAAYALAESDGAKRAVFSLTNTSRNLRIETATGSAGSETYTQRLLINATTGLATFANSVAVGDTLSSGNTITAQSPGATGIAYKGLAAGTGSGVNFALSESSGANRLIFGSAATTRNVVLQTATGSAGSEVYTTRMTVDASTGAVAFPSAALTAASATFTTGPVLTAGPANGVAFKANAFGSSSGVSYVWATDTGANRMVMGITPTTYNWTVETATGSAGSESYTTRLTMAAATGALRLHAYTAGALSSDASGNISSGTLSVPNGGTGQTTYTNGQILIGNSTGNTLTKAAPTSGPGITVTAGAGSLTFSQAGMSAYRTGTVTLVAGTATVNDAATTTNTRIRISYGAPGGTPGAVYPSARVASTSFTLTSTSALDTSTICYEAFEP